MQLPPFFIIVAWHRKLISTFRQRTDVTSSLAREMLEAAGWNFDIAMRIFRKGPQYLSNQSCQEKAINNMSSEDDMQESDDISSGELIRKNDFCKSINVKFYLSDEKKTL